MASPVTLNGLPAAKANFRRLPEVARTRLGEAARTTAMEIVRMAQGKVRVRFGVLQKYIGFTFSARTGWARVGVFRTQVTIGRGRRVSARILVRTSSGGITLVSPTRYAHLVEKGTIRSRAFPFMRPSVDAERGPHEQRVHAAGRAVERDMSAVGARTL